MKSVERLHVPMFEHRHAGIILLALALSASLYLGWVMALGEPAGFPLDDGWIHQTFARNLARMGQMAYNPGEPTAGSTAPLWTLLLVPGHLLAAITGNTFIPQLWSYLWGLASLGGTAWLTLLIARWGVQSAEGEAVFCIPCSAFRIPFPGVAALLVALDWHLVWAALSGMETTFFTCLALLLVYLTVKGHPPIICGLVAGLLTLTRPEGLLLSALCWLEMMRRREDEGGRMENGEWRREEGGGRIVNILAFPLVLIAMLLPYMAFTWSVAGRLLPNTFYAKTVSYTLPPGLFPILEYLGQVLLVLGSGPVGLLLPALAYLARRSLFYKGGTRHAMPLYGRSDAAPLYGHSDAMPLLWAWPLGLIALYTWRLPTVYQHGRYLMPALPFLILLGCWGLAIFPGKGTLRFYKVLLVGLTLFSWVYGARLYAWDVRFINRIQVQAALWLRANTEPEALIATHDIGAIGYFSGRRLLDTAGLITPEVIPLLRDQPRLLAYLQERRVNYVAQFPRWFPYISQTLADREVYRYHDERVIAAGGDDFVIYKTGW